jgi:transcriptional regulator with XRE-family HTH domain
MANSDRLKIGRTIRRLRLTKGWTQEDLADQAKLHPTYIGGIERGERNVGLDNLIKIARALRQPPSALFSGFSK